jgi:hypothetical protein
MSALLRTCLAVAALLALSACDAPFSHEPSDEFTSEDVVTIRLAEPSRAVLADGRDRTEVIVELGPDTPSSSVVELRTDWGTFAGVAGAPDDRQELTANAGGRILRAFLVSEPRAADARVVASVGGYEVTLDVPVRRADPARLVLTANRLRLDADGNETATLTATLFTGSGLGTVTEETRVFFRALDDPSGSARPELDRESLSDDSGRAIADLVTTQPGTYRIVATAENQPSATDTLTVVFEE